ncbi:hypothetical protein [Embleya sp. NPDC020630]|uniref:hypothetical protein n=1 Tax=Embleya sp. NPDC020630 TaxID=3363979 RepID=UPI0037B05779
MTTEQRSTPDEELGADVAPGIPAVIPLRELPAAAEAREQLLQAIAATARAVTERHAGQASGALVALARAYALVTSGTTAPPTLLGDPENTGVQVRAGGHQVGLCLEPEP